MLYLKDLVSDGYVGDVLSCHVSRITDGGLQRTSDRTWQRERDLGANTLTITHGHTIDALRFVVGELQPRLHSGQHPGQSMVRDRHRTVC